MDVNFWLWKICIWCLNWEFTINTFDIIHTLKFDLDQISPNSKNGATEKKTKHIFWPRKFKNVIITKRMFSKRRRNLSSVNLDYFFSYVWSLYLHPKPSLKIGLVNKAFLFWYWELLRKYFSLNRNKTFLLFKIESWSFQNLFEKGFRETSQNFTSIRQLIEKMK